MATSPHLTGCFRPDWAVLTLCWQVPFVLRPQMMENCPLMNSKPTSLMESWQLRNWRSSSTRLTPTTQSKSFYFIFFYYFTPRGTGLSCGWWRMTMRGIQTCTVWTKWNCKVSFFFLVIHQMISAFLVKTQCTHLNRKHVELGLI